MNSHVNQFRRRTAGSRVVGSPGWGAAGGSGRSGSAGIDCPQQTARVIVEDNGGVITLRDSSGGKKNCHRQAGAGTRGYEHPCVRFGSPR